MRNLLPGPRRPVGHDAPHGADLERVAVRCRLCERLDVLGRHGAVRAGARERLEVDASRLGEASCLREASRRRGGPRREQPPRPRHERRRGDNRCRSRSGQRRDLDDLPGREHDRDDRADGHLGALRDADGGERSAGGRLDLDRHLVGLDLEQRLALCHRLAVLLEPAQDLAGLLGHAERRHDHVSRHAILRRRPRRRRRRRASGCSGSTSSRAGPAALPRRCTAHLR